MASPPITTQNCNYHKCWFTGCERSKARCPDLHFFRFPTKWPKVCEQWVKNCANDNLTSLSEKTLSRRLVCEMHFIDDCFTSTMKTHLKKNAVPTLLSLDDGIGPQTPKQTADEVSLNDGAVMTPRSSGPSSRKALFTTPTIDCSGESPITTPLLKNFKSVKGRKQTPGKITPLKKCLFNKLKRQKAMKNKYQQAVRRSRAKQVKVNKKDLLQCIHSYFPEKVASLFCMQLNHTDQKTKPYTDKEKQQALSMRYKSPAMYDQMRNDGFALPGPATIARWLQGIDLRAGICGELLHFIQNKVQFMSEIEKKTVLMFDEMSMKHGLEYDSKRDLVEGLVDLGDDGRKPIPGSKVLLFMARGLVHKWKMPVAYYVTDKTITAKPISKLITNCVSALSTTGLDIKTVVCDQGSTNRKAANLLGVTKDAPFFTVGSKKIFFLYDFPHVMKCVRNNLMKCSIKFHEGTADWKHVQGLYNLDRAAIKARATKLTDKHISPNNFEKMSVRLATQVMSHSVSSAMATAVQTKQLPAEALETATFLKKVNDIFDAMNSRSKFSPNPHKCAVSDSTNHHLKVPLQTIEEGLKWARTWNRAGPKPGTRPPSFDGLEHTLKGTLMLWSEIKSEGISYLMTGRLNQDPLENEFSIARQKCGYDRNPTTQRFRQNLRHRIQTSLLKPPAGKNCESDDDDMLEQLSSSMKAPPPSNFTEDNISPESEPSINEISECEGEDERFEGYDCLTSPKETLEANAVRYFSGYSVHSTLNKFNNCSTCKEDLVEKRDGSHQQLDHQYQSTVAPDSHLVVNRAYKTESASGGLVNPSDETCQVAHKVLTVFDKHLQQTIHLVGVRKKIVLKCKQHIFQKYPRWLKAGSECEQHRNFFLERLITAKLKRSLKDMSKDMRQPGGGSTKSKVRRKLQNLKNI